MSNNIDKDKFKKLLKEAVENAFKKTFNNPDLDVHDEIEKEINAIPNITISSSDKDFIEYDGINVIENPSYLFDFNIFKTERYSYNYIIDNQEYFRDDIGHFTETEAFRDNSAYSLYVPFETFHQEESCFRVYLKSKERNIFIPVIADKDLTKFNNFIQYKIEKSFYNEICCFISNRLNLLKAIKDKKQPVYKICPIENILYWKDLFIDDVISEAETFDKNETGYPKAIWIDENRMTTHQTRIKFQHNNLTNTQKWATMIVDGKRNYPVENDFNATIKPKEVDLIRCFVHHNEDIIKRLFNPKDSYDLNAFKLDYVRIDNKGNIKEEPNKKFLDDNPDIELDTFINKDTFIVFNYNDRTYNLLIKGKLMFNEWFIKFEYIKNKNIFQARKDRNTILNIDIKGKIKR